MAQSASRSRSPRTATVATFSSQRIPAGRGPGAGFSASTAALGSLRNPLRVDVSLMVEPPPLQKLAQPPQQSLVLRAGLLLLLGPRLRRPDLDALALPRPGDFLDQARVLAQTGRDEDAPQPIHRALLRRRNERAREQPGAIVEHGERGDLGDDAPPRRRREGEEAVVDQVGGDAEPIGALGGELLAELGGEAGAPLGVDRVLEDAGKHPRSLWWPGD